MICINDFKLIVFDIKREMRQEDSFSCLLFNMIIKSLTRRLFQSVIITEFITLNEMMFKKEFYADDTTVYLNNLRK